MRKTNNPNRDNTTFLILYGKIISRTSEHGILGVSMTGDSVGEEGLFTPEFQSR